MDSFTQIILGIATAEICAGGKLQRRTLIYGSVLGTLPDLDVVAGQFMDPVNGMAIHRGFSHSILLFLILSPILGWIISKIERGRINFRCAALLVFWCLFTHVLLDLFTSWGTQVFWPFPHRIALKTIFVIDPLYTLSLLIFLIAGFRKTDYALRKKHVLLGLYVSSLYLLLGCIFKLYAVQQFKSALQQEQIVYEDLIVKPTAFNIILWNANVATKDTYLLGDYSLLDSQPVTFTRYAKNTMLEDKLRGNPDFETLKHVSEGWYIITKKDSHYYFNDLRFGLLVPDPVNPQFTFSYVFREENGRLRATEVAKQKRDGTALMKGIFKRIKGN